MIDGVILQNPSMFSAFFRGCEHWTFRNVKFIDYNNEDLGRYGGIDAYDPNNSSRAVMENCFVYAGDACTSMKSTGAVVET